MPLVVLGLLACLVPLRRVDHDVGVVSTESREGKQSGGPAATSASVVGDALVLRIEDVRACRDERWQTVLEEHRMETKPRGRFVSDWVWAGVLTSASVALWSVADPQTELGSAPFAAAGLLTPIAAIQLGTAIRTTARIGPPTFTRRTELAKADPWTRCGSAPFEGYMRGAAEVDDRLVRIKDTVVEDGAARFSTSAMPSVAWASPDWNVQLQEVVRTEESAPASKSAKSSKSSKSSKSKPKVVMKEGKEGPEVRLTVSGDLRPLLREARRARPPGGRKNARSGKARVESASGGAS